MLFLNFSDRPAGNCGSVAALCSQMLGGQVVNVSELFTQGCGACQTDCFQKDGCDWPCSNFFRFCERGCGWFGIGTERTERYLAAEKHFIVISNTNRSHFEEIFSEHVPPARPPHILFLSAAAYHRVSLRGDLAEVEAVHAVLRDFFAEQRIS